MAVYMRSLSNSKLHGNLIEGISWYLGKEMGFSKHAHVLWTNRDELEQYYFDHDGSWVWAHFPESPDALHYWALQFGFLGLKLQLGALQA